MFHHLLHRKMHRKPMVDFDMDMDMNMNMMTVAKVLAGSAMLYLGAKMIADEMMD